MHEESQAVRGAVGARPWGAILGELGVTGRTVQVTLRSDGKFFRIAFDRGLVVGATSPVQADTMTRIALSNRIIVSTQVDDIKRRIAVAPNLDDVDVLAATAQLDADATRALRNRVVLQRAARTFAIDQGEYEIEDRMPIAIKGIGVDVRSVIFLGARMNLSEERLRAYLRELSPKFALKPGVFETLDRYGFTPEEQPVLDALRAPTCVAELEASHRDIDPREIHAVVYALGSYGVLAEVAVAAPEPVASFPDPARVEALIQDKRQTTSPATRTTTMQVTERVRASTRNPTTERDELPPERVQAATLTPPIARQTRTSMPPSTTENRVPRAPTAPPIASSTRDVSIAKGTASLEPPVRMRPAEVKREEVHAMSLELESFELELRSKTSQSRRAASVRPIMLERRDVIELINERMALIASGADHFTMLGVSLGAAVEEVNAAYGELSRFLQPDYLAELGIRDEAFAAESVLAQVDLAYAVLTDRVRRPAYVEMLLAKRKPR